MPVNSQGSSLSVVTNVGGQMLDNDEYVAQRASREHNYESEPQSERAWASNYQPEPIYVEDVAPVIPDPAVAAAVKKDLKKRNLKPSIEIK